MAEHRGEQVVEVVRHPSGQTADRLQPLRVAQLLLALRESALGPAALGDVRRDPDHSQDRPIGPAHGSGGNFERDRPDVDALGDGFSREPPPDASGDGRRVAVDLVDRLADDLARPASQGFESPSFRQRVDAVRVDGEQNDRGPRDDSLQPLLAPADHFEVGEVLELAQHLEGPSVGSLDGQGGEIQLPPAEGWRHFAMDGRVGDERAHHGALVTGLVARLQSNLRAEIGAGAPGPVAFRPAAHQERHGLVDPLDRARRVGDERVRVGLVCDRGELLPLAIEDPELRVEGLEPALVLLLARELPGRLAQGRRLPREQLEDRLGRFSMASSTRPTLDRSLPHPRDRRRRQVARGLDGRNLEPQRHGDRRAGTGPQVAVGSLEGGALETDAPLDVTGVRFGVPGFAADPLVGQNEEG